MKAITIGEVCLLAAMALLSWFLVEMELHDWVILQWSGILAILGGFVVYKAFGEPG